MKKSHGRFWKTRILAGICAASVCLSSGFTGFVLASETEDTVFDMDTGTRCDRELFNYMVPKWLNREKRIDLSGFHATLDDVMAVNYWATEVFPELYYVGNLSYQLEEDGTVPWIETNYPINRDVELKAEGEKVLSLLNDSMSDLEKAMVIHDYLVMDIEYGGGYPYRHDVRGAVLDKEAVCEGYAKAYKYYMDRAGVPCEMVGGHSRGEGHAWNQVQINGKWYMVDVTWDDPRGEDIRHTYFLCSEDIFGQDHVWDREAYKICDDTTYDDAIWKDVTSPVFAGDGYLCYKENRALRRVKLENGIPGKAETFVTVSEPWKIYQGSASYDYMSLASKDNRLYYTTPKQIISCKYDGTDKQTVVTLGSESPQQIFGIEIAGGTLYYDTAAGIYETRTRNAYVLDENYKKKPYPISIQTHSVELVCGEGHMLCAYAPGKITYESEDPEICTVDQYGSLQTKKSGETKIKITTQESDLYFAGNETVSVKVYSSREEMEAGKQPESETEPEKQPESETETETEKQSESETGKQPESETEIEKQPESETETEKQSESETEKQPESETETEKQSESETEKQPESEAETEKQSESETEKQPESEAETEKQSESEMEKQPESETETEKKQPESESEKQPEPVTKPEKMTGVSAKAVGKQKIKVRWKKQSCTGYQIKISKTRDFKKTEKTVFIRGKKKNSQMISGLKAGTVYYIKVRSYKKTGEKISYGGYSRIQKVRTGR